MSASSPQPRTPSEEIAGLVERVTFFNEESGFSVLRVKVRGQRELVTVLGSLPSVSAGEWLTAEGWWVRDKEHGLQFKAKILKTIPPTTSEGVERYLASGFVKGIGPVLAKKLAMQSTGVYWIPLYDILEEHGIEVYLVNARDTKNLPGRKTDVQESQWLVKLHTYGLLRNSFRPSQGIRTMRT